MGIEFKRYTHTKGHTLTLNIRPLSRTDWWRINGWMVPKFLDRIFGQGYLVTRSFYFDDDKFMVTWQSKKYLSKSLVNWEAA